MAYLPIDLMTSELRNDRRLKVQTEQDPDVEFKTPTYSLLANLLDVNTEILNQLRLLNVRFEEMSETHINEQDIEE